MIRLKEKIRECEEKIKEWREYSTKYSPVIILGSRESKEDSFYGIYPRLISTDGSQAYSNEPLTWGFKAMKSRWPFAYVDSCNLGGADTNCARTFGYKNAKQVAFSKAKKLAEIISRRTNARIILEERE